MKKWLIPALLIAFAIYTFFPRQDKVIEYRLKWLFNASVSGDIWAEEAHYFQQAGLDVRIKEGSPEKNAINELELGHADFGVASADQVIRAVSKGAKIIVIAQIFQVNPMQWIYRSSLGEIRTPDDLKYKKIGITFGGNDETIMKTILARAGIREDQVFLSGVRFDFTPFLTGKVDVWPVYQNSQGVILAGRMADEGEPVLFFNPADAGVRFVANSVITTSALMEKQPETVKRFVSALLKAWESAMAPENEAAVLAAVQKRDSGTQGRVQQKQLIATRALVKPLPDKRIGNIDMDAWRETEAIMLKEKLIQKPVHIERYLVQIP